VASPSPQHGAGGGGGGGGRRGGGGGGFVCGGVEIRWAIVMGLSRGCDVCTVQAGSLLSPGGPGPGPDPHCCLLPLLHTPTFCRTALELASLGTSSLFFSNPMRDDSLREVLGRGVKGREESERRMVDTARRVHTSRWVGQ
jgi:hypothetical protein